MRPIHQIADHYGLDAQLDQTIEECAELILAIRKYKRYPGNGINSVLEELADVKIMCEQIEYLLGAEEAVEEVMGNKIIRQLERMEADGM